jgi:DNA invertase Pin-like site-specific DNA recombinase
MKAAIYLRRSEPGEERKNYSIENQRNDTTEFVTSQGGEVARAYSDPGGKSYTLYRPVYQQLVRDARAGMFDTVVVGRYDRFSRSQTQQGAAINELRQVGVEVISATQPVPEGIIGDMLRNRYAFAAELERENMRQRSNSGKWERVKDGKIMPAGAPKFGYMFNDSKTKDRYVLNPVTAPIVQRIFALYTSGLSLLKLAHTLDEERVPTPSQVHRDEGSTMGTLAAKWSPAMLRHIMTDTAYIGKLTANRMQTKWVPQQDPITGEVTLMRKAWRRDLSDPLVFIYPPEACPPLVDEATYTKANNLLASNRNMSTRNIKRPNDALLAGGLAVCGYCGSKMGVGWNNKDNGYRYRCMRLIHRRRDMCGADRDFQVSAKTLDTAVWAWFSDQISHPERMQVLYEEYVRKADESSDSEKSRLKAVRDLIESALGEEQSYLAALGSAREDYRAVLVGRAQEAHDRAVEAQKELEELEALVVQRDQQLSLLESFSVAALKAADKLKTASADQKRLALRIYDVKVQVWEKGHKPRFRLTWLGGLDPNDSVASQHWDFEGGAKSWWYPYR